MQSLILTLSSNGKVGGDIYAALGILYHMSLDCAFRPGRASGRSGPALGALWVEKPGDQTSHQGQYDQKKDESNEPTHGSGSSLL